MHQECVSQHIAVLGSRKEQYPSYETLDPLPMAMKTPITLVEAPYFEFGGLLGPTPQPLNPNDILTPETLRNLLT